MTHSTDTPNQTYQRATELMESWLNGNRTFVYKEVLDARDSVLMAEAIEDQFLAADRCNHAYDFNRGLLRYTLAEVQS